MSKPSIEIICEMPKFKVGLELYVRSLGYEICPSGQIGVVVDARMGTALRYLETNPKAKPMLIITDNTCPVYHQCLLHYQPEGILFNGDGSDHIAEAVAAVQNGQHYNNLPKARIKFSPTDIKIARELARGLQNKEIGLLFELSPNSAETYVANVLDKARAISTDGLIKNRTQFALWFWGQDHVLDTP